jgi:hypothetical protein
MKIAKSKNNHAGLIHCWNQSQEDAWDSGWMMFECEFWCAMMWDNYNWSSQILIQFRSVEEENDGQDPEGDLHRIASLTWLLHTVSTTICLIIRQTSSHYLRGPYVRWYNKLFREVCVTHFLVFLFLSSRSMYWLIASRNRSNYHVVAPPDEGTKVRYWA